GGAGSGSAACPPGLRRRRRQNDPLPEAPPAARAHQGAPGGEVREPSGQEHTAGGPDDRQEQDGDSLGDDRGWYPRVPSRARRGGGRDVPRGERDVVSAGQGGLRGGLGRAGHGGRGGGGDQEPRAE